MRESVCLGLEGHQEGFPGASCLSYILGETGRVHVPRYQGTCPFGDCVRGLVIECSPEEDLREEAGVGLRVSEAAELCPDNVRAFEEFDLVAE